MKPPSAAAIRKFAPGMLARVELHPLEGEPGFRLELRLSPEGSARWARQDGESLRAGLLSDVRRFADCIRTLVVLAHPSAGGRTCAVLAVAPH